MYSVCSVVGFLAGNWGQSLGLFGNWGQSLGLFNPPFGNLQISASPLPTTHYPPLPSPPLLSLSLSLSSVPLCLCVSKKNHNPAPGQ